MEAILLQVGLMGKKRERPRCGVSKGAMHRWCELVFIFCLSFVVGDYGTNCDPSD